MQKSNQIIREERKKKENEEKERIEELIDKDRDAYIKGLYDQRQAILERIEKRKKTEEQFAKRGSMRNKSRLKVMAGMVNAIDSDKTQFLHPGADKKDGMDDNFGVDDQDWDVYRDINKGGFDDENEEDQEAVNSIEKLIADVDP